MDKSNSGSSDQPLNCTTPKFDDKIQYLLSAEEQLLQSISSRAPLPGVLNEICSALDCQIGNVVSLISLPEADGIDHAAIALNAALFGLYTFCSEGLAADNEEPLGCLEMYSSVARTPSANEIRLIERAKCLAALAIKLDNEAACQGKSGKRQNPPVCGRVIDWPVSLN
jgi:hypothetical protein